MKIICCRDYVSEESRGNSDPVGVCEGARRTRALQGIYLHQRVCTILIASPVFNFVLSISGRLLPDLKPSKKS